MNERSKKIETLRQEAIDFFLYSYLEIDNENDEETKRIRKCVERAYLDLARTLRFNEKDEQKRADEKQIWVDDVTEEITKMCELASRKDFDEKHEKICNKISKYSNVLEETFTYGQAQKWVNMTLKYMWMCGIEGMDSIEEFLHIPVDSYIMEAAAGKKRKGNGLKVQLPTKDNNKKLFYSEEKSKAWSKWNVDDYKDFQDDIRQALKDECIPIKWENKNWIEIAECRKKK